MTEQLNVQQMAERLCAADNILVLCHKNPDGDTIGCGSALCHALKALGRTAAVLCSDAVPSRYSFTAPVMFRGGFEPKTVVAVDVASVQLFGENNGVPQYTRHVDLCIDHHAGNSGYADFTLLDGSAAAAAELLYEVICEMGVEITPLIANCLYTGLATDTGCFRFSSTTANTHLVAAKLILAGAQLEELNTLLFDTKPRERMEAERIARNHLEYHLDDRCALMYLTRDEIEQSGVDPADLEELTSLPISIEGVKVGLLLRQQPGGSYRISVRTAKGVIAKLRGILGTRKLGHSGTLDPMATGVLPVFCGGASKAVDLQLDHTKTYCARLKLGLRTDTGDITGTVLETAPVTAGEAELLAVLPRFLGPQMQTPPMYSAVKLNGQPLYKLAREGVTVERKARPIEILDIRYGGSPAEDEYVLTVRCSKGTYIRTLLEDIAAAMGQKGTMSALRRTTAGVYTEADAHTLEEIQTAKDAGPEALQALMLPVESVFESLPLLVVEPRVEQHLYNGCPTSRYPAADGRYRVRSAEGQFLGLAKITGGVLKVEKLFVERNEKD